MGYSKKYELGELILHGPTKTYHAIEIGSGRPVMVHLLEGQHDYSALERFLRKARWLQAGPPGSGSRGVLEVSTDAAAPYVVTEVLEEFNSLPQWVEQQCREASEQATQYWNEQIHHSLEVADHEGAFNAVQEALAEFPDSIELQEREQAIRMLCRGLELCEQGRYADGVNALSQAYEMDHQDSAVRAAVTNGLLAQARRMIEDDWQGADELVQVVLRLDRHHERARNFSRQINPKREELVAWCVDKAEQLEAQGEQKAALALLDEGLTAHPDDPRLALLKEELEQSLDGRRPAARSRKHSDQDVQLPVAKQEPAGVGSATLPEAGRMVLALVRSALSIAGHKIAAALGPRCEAAWLRWMDTGRSSPLLLSAALGLIATLVLMAATLMIWNRGPAAAGNGGYARVIRSSEPGALISIDGSPCSNSPCEIELAAGTHEARAELAGYRVASMFFEVSAPESGENAAPVAAIELALDPLPPVLRLSSDLAEAQVTLDGEKLGRLQDGELEIELQALAPGVHILTVSERGSRAAVKFETQAGAAPVILEPIETSNLKALVVASLGARAMIHGDEEASEASLDGRSLGALPRQGLAVPDLSAGGHEIAVGPANDQRKLTFESGPAPSLTAYLRSDRNVGALRIVTGESGVAVYLNGRKDRRVTQRGRLLLYLEPGDYKVRVEKPGFQPAAEQTAEVRKGQQTSLGFDLKAEPRTASLLVHNGVPGAEVWLGETALGTVGAEGSFAASGVPPGTHKVSFRKPQFRRKEVPLDFIAGESVEVDGALTSSAGMLAFEITPPDAGARVVFRREGESLEHIVVAPSVTLEEGTYTVSARAKGYQDFAATFRVAAGATRVAEVTLRRIAVEKRAPSLELGDWEGVSGWYREGNLLARKGGGIALAPGRSGAGLYEFSLELRSGRRLEWVVNYIDDNNYELFQIGKDNFYRIEVRDGKKSKAVRVRHPLDQDRFFQIRVEVTKDAIVHRVLYSGAWTIIDRWADSEADFAQGRFGFNVPGRDDVALRSFTFRPDF
jgi:tetratricopeptide (TPR) repeat protein